MNRLRSARLLLAFYVGCSAQGSMAADPCAEATKRAEEFIDVTAQLARNGFTDPAQLQRQGQLVTNPPDGNNQGYYVYTFGRVQNCAIQNNGYVRLELVYVVAGRVAGNVEKPKVLPTFSEMEGTKRLVARSKDGKLEWLTQHDPFYPPIVAIQDYRDRLESASVQDRASYQKILKFLEIKQNEYLKKSINK